MSGLVIQRKCPSFLEVRAKKRKDRRNAKYSIVSNAKQGLLTGGEIRPMTHQFHVGGRDNPWCRRKEINLDDKIETLPR